MQPTKILGNAGEEAVTEWLIKNQFTILTRNYQTKLGEVDIIAARDEVIAFVEVKTRNTEYFPIAQTVTWRKQQRIIKAARHFILANHLRDKVFRFDVATVLFSNYHYNVEYIQNAFSPRY